MFLGDLRNTLSVTKLSKKKLLYISGATIAGLVTLGCIIFLALYLLPPHAPDMPSSDKLSYKQAVKKATSIQKADQKKSKFKKGCDTQILEHGSKTARSVVMFHGITSCPSEYSQLAKTFFDAGYNVYTPLAPKQGTTDAQTIVADITTDELAKYVTDSHAIGAALGDSVGFIGTSGGATIATWSAQTLDVTNLLVLSPFYDPSLDFMPHWQRPLLLSLYGRNLIPDTYTADFSRRTLAKYLQFIPSSDTLKANKKLAHVAVVTSAKDSLIDLDQAHILPKKLAKKAKASFQQARLAPEMNIPHDIVNPIGTVKDNQAQLNNLYLSFYENKEPAKEL